MSNIIEISKHYLLTIDLPNLIKTNQYYNLINQIKNYEDTLQKIFLSSKNSQLINDPYVFLWKIKKNEINNDLFVNLEDLEFEKFDNYNDNINNNNGDNVNNDDNGDNVNNVNNISTISTISTNELLKFKSLDNIVLTGPFIRSHINNINSCPIRKEVYIYKYTEQKWKDIINLEHYTDNKSEYVFENKLYKICLIKKKYKSPAHILLQHDYIKRVGWINGYFYISSMFLIEYQKHISNFDPKYKDPIMNLPYDPLEIYQNIIQDRTHPIKIIETVDLELINKLDKKDYEKLYDIKNKSNNLLGRKTCIEFCLDKYASEQHPIIIHQLKQILIILNQHTYKRPPFLYARILDYHNKFPDIYALLNQNNIYNIDENECLIKNFENCENIDTFIIIFCIQKDNIKWLLDYLQYINKNINKEIIDIIIKYNAIDILKNLIIQQKIDQNFIYYAILMTQELDLFKLITFVYDIAINYLKDILEKALIRSFYFLWKIDNSIVNISFDNQQNLLHQLKYNLENYKAIQDIITLILKIKPELINLIDEFNETPIIFHSINNPELLQIFLDFDFDPTIFDNDNNSFVHYLCKHNQIIILKTAIKKYPELLNVPNNNGETPCIVSCINCNEDNFYTLKGFGADLLAQDKYGNTVYHYICKNSLCLAMIIENIKNYFGITPENYCYLSTKYYTFVN